MNEPLSQCSVESSHGARVDSAVIRGLDVLWMLSSRGKPMTIQEVVDAMAVSRATAYRSLEQLAEAGWLVAVGRPAHYSISARVIQLGLLALQRNRAREVALTSAISCARVTQKICNTALYHDGSAIYVDRATVLEDKVTILPLGFQAPAPSTALGKILLAYQSDEEVMRVAQRGLPKFTRYTKTDPEAILEDIRICRARGYSIADREFGETSGGLGVPIFDHAGKVAIAFGVAAVTLPINDSFLQAALGLAQLCAARASAELGYHAMSGNGLV